MPVSITVVTLCKKDLKKSYAGTYWEWRLWLCGCPKGGLSEARCAGGGLHHHGGPAGIDVY